MAGILLIVILYSCIPANQLMTEDLLQDLALYKKSHEKAISVAARSLIGLFREVCIGSASITCIYCFLHLFKFFYNYTRVKLTTSLLVDLSILTG